MAVGLLVEAEWEGLWTEMPRAWRELFAREGEIGEHADTLGPFIDISIGRDDKVYRELAGVVVGRCETLPEGMFAVTVPENRYLSRVHDGPLSHIAESFGAIYAHAQERGIAAADLKLDMGYGPGETSGRHELFVAVEPVARPRVERGFGVSA